MRCATPPSHKIQCASPDVFSLHTGTCASSSSQPNIDLTGYVFKHDIIISQHLPIGYHYVPIRHTYFHFNVQKGDIIVVEQTSGTGTIAKINETSDNDTALIYPSIKGAIIDDPFPYSKKMASTKQKFALRFVLSERRIHDLVHSYNKTGSFGVKAKFPGTNTAKWDPIPVTINVLEKIQSVNITAKKKVLVGIPTLIVIQAKGTRWYGYINSKGFHYGIPSVPYTFTESKVYKMTVFLLNVVSTWAGTFQTEAIRPVVVSEVNLCWKGMVFNSSASFQTTFTSGDTMNISITLDDDILFKNDSISTNYPAPLNLIKKLIFTTLGAHNVSVFADNELSNVSIQCSFYVEIPIEGLSIYEPKPIAVSSNNDTILTFGVDKGTNITYEVKMNDHSFVFNGSNSNDRSLVFNVSNSNNQSVLFNCSNINCTKVTITMKARTFPGGNYTFMVCASNRVTPKTCQYHNITILDPVEGMRLGRCIPTCINAMGDSFRVLLIFGKGTDVVCDWWSSDYPFKRVEPVTPVTFRHFKLKCEKPVMMYMTANCSNPLGFVVKHSNFSCLYPVKELVLTSDSPQVVSRGTINFTLTSTPPVHPPTNTSCFFDYGDLQTEFLENCVLPMNFTHK